MSRKSLLLGVGVFVVLFGTLVTRSIPATINHYEYVFTPGSVYVYDLDAVTSTYSVPLVKTVTLSNTANIGNANIRGAVANAATGMMYISYDPTSICCGNGHLLKYNLATDTVVWDVQYSSQKIGTDSHSISPDGSTIYMPDGESTSDGLWYVISAADGSIIRTINSGGKGPHNTITTLDGTHLYLGPRYSGYLVEADAASGTIIKQIGPVLNAGIRPFTINSEETFAFITSSDYVGFSVGDIQTGQIRYQVFPPGYFYTNSYNNISGVSHGISLSPDEKELYLIDLPFNHVHVFDVTGLPGSPPTDVADIALKCTLPDEGWLQHTRDGRFVVVGDCGDVIDTSTRQIVANMPQLLKTRIYNEVDFQGGVPYFSPLSRNQGGYASTATSPGTGVSPNFSLSATPTSTTLTAGGSATFSVNVNPTGGFNQQVTLSCSGLPTGVTCLFSPNPVTPNGVSPATATVAVQTSAASIVVVPLRSKWKKMMRYFHWPEFGYVCLLILAVELIISNRRSPRLTFGLAAVVFLVAAGCKGVSSNTSGSNGASYTMVLTGTSGSGPSALSSSTSVVVTIN